MPMGYMGYCKVDDLLVLCNSTGLEVQVEPIFSEAVIGQGWQNAASTTHYAENALTYSGGIDVEFEWYDGLLTAIFEWIYSNRVTSKKTIISPNGIDIFTYGDGGSYPGNGTDGVWLNSGSFTAGEGSAMTASFDCMALERTHSTGAASYYANSTPGQGGAPTYPLNPSDANLYPVPFWKTTASLTINGVSIGGANADATTWNFDWTNNAMLLYTCSGTQGASAVLMGAIDVTGGITIYSPDGIDDSFLAVAADNTVFNVNVGAVSAFYAPYCQINGTTYGVGGKNEIVTRALTWRAIGDGVHAPGGVAQTTAVGADNIFA